MDFGIHSHVLDDLPIVRTHCACRRRASGFNAYAVGQDEDVGKALV
jgi:hypothetical protein